MAEAASRAAGELASYVERMRSYRFDLQWAMNDLEYSEDPERTIYYLFDTNVVALYLNPREGIHAVRVLPERTGEDKLLLIELATVMAEIMFSGNLPGQNGEAPYITVDHAAEVVSMSSAISRRLKPGSQIGELRTNFVLENFGEALNSVRRIERGDKSPDSLLLARQHFRPFLDSVAGVSLKEGARLTKIFKDDLIANFVLLPDFSESIMSPSPELLADLSAEITATKQERKKRGSSGNDPDADATSSDKIFRDAMSIAQVHLLNDVADENLNRYVLVTCDDGLMEAYERWFPRQKNVLFALRHPRQYLPLADLPETDEATDKKKLSEVIDSLLSGFGGPEGASENEEKLLDDADFETKVRKLSSEWAALCNTAVRQSVDKLAIHVATEFNVLLPAFKEIDTEEGLANAIQTILSDVDRLHLTIGAVGSVLRYVRNARQRRKRGARAPIAIKCRALEIFVGAPEIDRYLSALVSPGHAAEVKTLRSRLSAHLPKQEFYLPPFFAACVCLRAQEWDAAYVFAQGAIKLMDALEPANVQAAHELEDARYELFYITAVARRFRLKSAGEFQRARETLERCQKHHYRRKQALWEARAYSELAALNLMRLVASQFLPESYGNLTEHEEGRTLRETIEFLRAAQKILDDHMDHRDEPIYRAIHDQVVTNFAQSAIYNRIFPKLTSIPGHHVSELQRVADEMSAIRQGMLDSIDEEYPAAEINFHMLRWVISRGNRDDADVACRIIDEYLSIGDNLSELDIKELHEYKSAIKADQD